MNLNLYFTLIWLSFVIPFAFFFLKLLFRFLFGGDYRSNMTGVFVYKYCNGNRNNIYRDNNSLSVTTGKAGDYSIIFSFLFSILPLTAWYPSAPLVCVQELVLHGVPSTEQTNYMSSNFVANCTWHSQQDTPEVSRLTRLVLRPGVTANGIGLLRSNPRAHWRYVYVIKQKYFALLLGSRITFFAQLDEVIFLILPDTNNFRL